VVHQGHFNYSDGKNKAKLDHVLRHIELKWDPKEPKQCQ
jgi:hypothetical protein